MEPVSPESKTEQQPKPMSDSEKAKYLERQKSQATDEHPIRILLEHPESINWQAKELPRQAILGGIIYDQKGTKRTPKGVLLDFSRVIDKPLATFANFPLLAVNINKETGEVSVDCRKAIRSEKIISPFNDFVAPLTRVK